MVQEATPYKKLNSLPDDVVEEIVEVLDSRLSVLRKMNDKQSSPEETAFLRGRIAELKAILAELSNRSRNFAMSNQSYII